MFQLPRFRHPDFNNRMFVEAPEVKTQKVIKDGVAPENFHATTIFPEYFKINGKWVLVHESRMDSVVVIRSSGIPEVIEFRKLQQGDEVVVGRTEDGSEGIFVYTEGFVEEEGVNETFAFRTGRSRETSYSRDYDRLYELLKYERDHGYIVWVLGPAVVFDSDSRNAFISLIENGYIHAVFAGNELATHDMEGDMFTTALGQDIYSQRSMPNGHYHHLDVINRARNYPSLNEFVKERPIHSGVIQACLSRDIPVILAGSIRDDGPLPGVYSDVYKAQDAMRMYTRKATTVIGMATQLHSIATGNMTPAYQVIEGVVRPVYIYSVDISEFAVNKLRDRGSLAVTSIVTNIQDFLVHIQRNLIL